ncbi:MAG TPA: hypothetical protein VM120_08735 [Bryobacteraceae bacterium]|nr:hypothetical protein [Bryobacteraceae bacterium]
MFLRFWFRPPRVLLASFLAVTLLPAAALLWLGWRFFDQDRALAAQRVRERREQAADLIAVALQQSLAAAQQQLEQTIADGEPDAAAIVFHGDDIESTPRLLYYPVVPSPNRAPAALFARGEEMEFQHQNFDGAMAAFRELTGSPDTAIRAGAHLRIARNLRKAGQFEVALAEYQKMMGCGPVPVDGIPADLVARRANFSLLDQLGRTPEGRKEAEAVASGLNASRWQLTRAAFLHYAEAAGYHPPPEALALSEAVEWLWDKRKLAPSGLESMAFKGREMTLLWRDNHALVAGPRYAEHHWLAPLAPLLKSQSVRIALHKTTLSGSGASVRTRRHGAAVGDCSGGRRTGGGGEGVHVEAPLFIDCFRPAGRDCVRRQLHHHSSG